MSNLRFAVINYIESGITLMNGPQVILGAINSCTSPGDPTITRASGSYVTDGVRPGALLAASGIGARFPGSTYVRSVTDLVLTMSANANSAGTNEAATLTPYVARDEVAPYTMDNLLVRDRRVLWQQQSGGAGVVDFDLGANRSVGYIGMHGHRAVPGVGNAGILSCTVKYATSATGYPPASGGSWTNATVLSAPARDLGVVLSNISARYWRFDIDSVNSAFTLGRFQLSTALDLGFIATSIRERRAIPSTIDRSAGDDPVVTYRGDIRSFLDFEFNSITGSPLNTLRTIAAQTLPFALIDQSDVASDVIITEPIDILLKFLSGSAALYDVRLSAEVLG